MCFIEFYIFYRKVTTRTVILETCGTPPSAQMQPHVLKTVLLMVSMPQHGTEPMESEWLKKTDYLLPLSPKDHTPEMLDLEPSFWMKACSRECFS